MLRYARLSWLGSTARRSAPEAIWRYPFQMVILLDETPPEAKAAMAVAAGGNPSSVATVQ
jgi:hypothetical protein